MYNVKHTDAQVKRFQLFAYGLQKICADECYRQIQEAFAMNRQWIHSLQQFLRSPQPQEAISLEWSVWVAVLQGASEQTKAWTDLVRKVQACCEALATMKPVTARADGTVRDD